MKVAIASLVLMTAAAAGCTGQAAHVGDDTDSIDLATDAKLSALGIPGYGDSIDGNLKGFQALADQFDGHRGMSTNGYNASADFVVNRIGGAELNLDIQSFPFLYTEALAENLSVDGKAVPVRATKHTASTPVGGMDSTWFVVPTRGCTDADYAGLNVRGAIVLVRRSGREACSLAQQEAAAANAGAAAIVLYDSGGFAGALPQGQARIPVAGISTADAMNLFAKHGAPAHLEVRELVEERLGINIIAETKTGRKDHIITIGAHLDSVQGSPGINDNGSGAAVLLASAVRRGGSPAVDNAVRYIWWGAGALEPVGSKVYVDSLTPEQRANIAMYINLDTIGSSNAGYFVMDGDDSEHSGRGPGPAGSAEIESALVREFAALGVRTEPTDLNDDSDQGPFLDAGIAAGGITTGSRNIKTRAQAMKWGGTAGIPFDPCYHQACDTYGNINKQALERNAKVLDRIIARFASAN